MGSSNRVCPMKYVIDRFGDDVRTEITDKAHFTATLEVSVSQTFFAWVSSLPEEFG